MVVRTFVEKNPPYVCTFLAFHQVSACICTEISGFLSCSWGCILLHTSFVFIKCIHHPINHLRISARLRERQKKRRKAGSRWEEKKGGELWINPQRKAKRSQVFIQFCCSGCRRGAGTPPSTIQSPVHQRWLIDTNSRSHSHLRRPNLDSLISLIPPFCMFLRRRFQPAYQVSVGNKQKKNTFRLSFRLSHRENPGR